MNIRDEIKAYLDGELNDVDSQRVQKALAEDPTLQKEAEDMKLISRSIQQHAAAGQPEGAEDTLRRMQNMQVRRRPWAIRYAPALALAGCLVLGMFMVGPMTRTAGKTVDAAAFPSDAEAKSEAAAPMMESAPSADLTKPNASEGRASVAAKAANPTAPPVANTMNRDIVKTGSMELRVKSVQETMAEVQAMVKSWQGYVEQSTSQVGDATKTGQVSLRIPSAQFETAFTALKRLGEVRSESTSGEDVTGQVVDTEARIAAKKDEIRSLREILRQARRVGEVIEIRDRISEVQGEIDSYSGQLKVLKDTSRMSTIYVSLIGRPEAAEPTEDKGWAGDSWNVALQNLANFGRAIGQFFIHILVYAPIWVPVAALGWLLWRRANRNS